MMLSMDKSQETTIATSAAKTTGTAETLHEQNTNFDHVKMYTDGSMSGKNINSM